jgi:hypothetical protein
MEKDAKEREIQDGEVVSRDKSKNTTSCGGFE